MHASTLLAFPVLFSLVSAYCSMDDLRCCLTEFMSLVTPRGLTLSDQRLSTVCERVRDETVGCMEEYLDQCLRNETGDSDLKELVNKTTSFIDNICSPTSDFMTKLASKEACILGSSSSFQTCYNKTVLPDGEKDSGSDALKQDCCEYKELRNCAVQTVEEKCGAVASQLVHEQVVNINGAIVEWACTDIFKECGNSAVILASSAFYVLCTIVLLRISL